MFKKAYRKRMLKWLDKEIYDLNKAQHNRVVITPEGRSYTEGTINGLNRVRLAILDGDI